MNVTLQIPLSEYGKIATLAAAANMPIDKYVINRAVTEIAAAEADKAENKQD